MFVCVGGALYACVSWFYSLIYFYWLIDWLIFSKHWDVCFFFIYLQYFRQFYFDRFYLCFFLPVFSINTSKLSSVMDGWSWLSMVSYCWLPFTCRWLSLIIFECRWLSLSFVVASCRSPSLIADCRLLSFLIVDYQWLTLAVVDYHQVLLTLLSSFIRLSLVFTGFHWLSSVVFTHLFIVGRH